MMCKMNSGMVQHIIKERTSSAIKTDTGPSIILSDSGHCII